MNTVWSSTQILQSIGGLLVAMLLAPAIRWVFHRLVIEVEDETSVLVTRFGKLERTIAAPGAHFFPQKILPWVGVIPVSMQRDFRHYRDIHVNDRSGTTVIVDLWIEFRLTDAERALFRIENWEKSLQSLLTHSATSILGAQEFKQILENRSELGNVLKSDILAETTRWGLRIEEVFIRQVSVLPEISRHMFEAVAARLERAKADVDEEGRIRVAELEAETSRLVAALVAEAKGQYPAAVGKAYEELARDPEVFAAYRELYELSLVRPHRTIAFRGFSRGEVREMDAVMAVSPDKIG